MSVRLEKKPCKTVYGKFFRQLTVCRGWMWFLAVFLLGFAHTHHFPLHSVFLVYFSAAVGTQERCNETSSHPPWATRQARRCIVPFRVAFQTPNAIPHEIPLGSLKFALLCEFTRGVTLAIMPTTPGVRLRCGAPTIPARFAN